MRARAAVLVFAALAALHSADGNAGSPRYSDIVLSDTKGGGAKSAFNPQTPKLYMNARLMDVPAGSKVRSDWIAVKTQVAPPNYKIDSSELHVGPGMDKVDFNFSKPTAGWPEGDYRVDLLINGKPWGDVKFRIVK